MSFKATVKKLIAASSAEIGKLVQWLEVSKTPIDLQNPNLQFATVTNERNEIVGCVPFERVFIVSADAVAQTTSEANDLPAGFAAASAIESAAQAQGVGKVLLILAAHHPPFPGEKFLRVIEQPVAQTKPMPEAGRHSQPSAIFIN